MSSNGTGSTLPRDLSDLAGSWGLQIAYSDALGERRRATPEALVAVLQRLGAPLDSPDGASDALRARRLHLQQQVLDPVTVAWDGRGCELLLRLPAAWASGLFELRLMPEWGAAKGFVGSVDDLPVMSEQEVEGARYVSRKLALREALPTGYHRASVEIAGAVFDTLILSAPRRAWTPEGHPRAWGVFAPLYALRSQRSPGAGDLADLRALLQGAHAHGGSFVQTLPLLSAYLLEPCEPSPYLPVSRRYWNELYLQLERIPELAESEAARKRLESPGYQDAWARLRAQEQVAHREQAALKRGILEELSKCFFESAHPRRAAYERFVDRDPGVEDYARFRAVQERLGRSWHVWPEAMKRGDLTHAEVSFRAVHYHAYVQFLMHEQLGELSQEAREIGPGLLLDLPMGMHPDGYDTWREQELYLPGAAVGAPPDPFFQNGQNWGFPLLVPEAERLDGYRYVRECLRAHLRFAGVLRIDHVMGLHRRFVIPSGMDAKDGIYVKAFEEELYAVAVLESHRHRAEIVGEDLGTVPRSVRRSMTRRGLLRTYVSQFEVSPEGDPALAAPPALSMASLNTHDLPTFAAFWKGVDIADRVALGFLEKTEAPAQQEERRQARESLRAALHNAGYLTDPGESASAVMRALLAHLGASDARLVTVNLEDLWLETEPQNVPGTVNERPNWRRKHRFILEEILQMPEVLLAFELLASARPPSEPDPQPEEDADELLY